MNSRISLDPPSSGIEPEPSSPWPSALPLELMLHTQTQTHTHTHTQFTQGGREISAIIVTEDYLCYKEPKSPYNFFFLILIFNELFKFKTSDERQH